MSQLLYPDYPNSWPFVMESRTLESVLPSEVDQLWAEGWRYFGADFFRSSLLVEEVSIKRQVALRLELDCFQASKSQRRTLRRNRDLQCEFQPAHPGEVEGDLFIRHKERFKHNVPTALEEFLGDQPDGKPCEAIQLSVRLKGRLVAASFLGIGAQACSSVYAVFDPDVSRRRLGIYTMLMEIEYARQRGLKHYYSGYATIEPSCYDYKKQFSGLSYFDWSSGWRPVDEMGR